MAKFFQGGAERSRFFGVMEKGAEFGFSCGGKDHFHYGGQVEDRAIENVGLGLVAKVEMATLATAGADSVEIGGVAVEFEDHVAGLITYGAIGVRSTVIEELLQARLVASVAVAWAEESSLRAVRRVGSTARP